LIPPDYVRRHATAQSTLLDRARLMLLALEGGQAFLARARAALERGDVGSFVADVARTQDVVVEIAQTTDARSSEVAGRLAAFQELMVRRLAQANAKRSLELVDEIVCAFGPIVEAYRQAVGSDGGV
jgi:flagellar biosynthetic protein FliS